MRADKMSPRRYLVPFYLGAIALFNLMEGTRAQTAQSENSTTNPTSLAVPHDHDGDFLTINMCCNLNVNSAKYTSCGDEDKIMNAVNLLKGSEGTPRQNLTFSSYLMASGNEDTFYVRSFRPNCTNGFVINDFRVRPNRTNEFLMHSSGYIEVGRNMYNSTYYRPNQYCLNGLEKGHIQLLTCKPPCSLTEPCIQKCCPLGGVVSKDGNRWKCYEARSKLIPLDDETFVNNSSKDMTKEEILRYKGFYHINNPQTWTNCVNNTFDTFSDDLLKNKEAHPINESTGFEKRTYFILENGEIFYRRKGGDFRRLDYACVDGLVDPEELKTPNSTAKKTIIFACNVPGGLAHDADAKTETAPSTATDKKPKSHDFYGAFAVSCSIFALATIIVYGILWEKQNVYGWMFVSFCTTVFGLFLFSGIAHLVSENQTSKTSVSTLPPSASCGIIALICHFCFVASFSWLAVLSLELWLTFRAVTIAGPRSNPVARYLVSGLFGWGIPILTTMLSLRQAKTKASPASNFHAKMLEHCLASTQTMWEFVYGPSLILFIVTIVCFILTTKTFNEYKRCTQSTANEIPNSKTYSQFVKLLYVIIFVWIVEGITWTLQATNTAPMAWHIFLTINCLQPVAIFYIFALNPDTLKDLAEKLFSMNCPLTPAVWLLRLLRRSSGFHHGPGIDGDQDGILADESSPLSLARPQYREVPRSDYLDVENVDENPRI